MYVFDVMKVIEIFCKVDDFCQELFHWRAQNTLLRIGGKSRGPKARLSSSEMITILLFYHLSGFKCFKYYYQRLILGLMKDYFPQAPSYQRFVELIPRNTLILWLFLQSHCREALASGIYYIDSTKLPVCDNRRIHSHKVFAHLARRGKTSTGWFFGLKLHMVVNHLGQMVAFHITPGNVSDNNHQLLHRLLKGLEGKCFGDKGYLSKLFDQLLEQGLQLITKIRKKMKNVLIKIEDKKLLNKRTISETIFDILKHICDIDHSRHRSPENAITHILAGLGAYGFLDQKPSIFRKGNIREFIPKID